MYSGQGNVINTPFLSDINGNATLGYLQIPRSLIEPITPPKVIENNTFDLDLLCQQAITRITYAINANCDYAIKQIKESFNLLKNWNPEIIYFNSIEEFPPKEFGLIGNLYIAGESGRVYQHNGRDYVPFESMPESNIKGRGGAGGTGCYEKGFINSIAYSGGGGGGGIPRP